MQVSERPEEGVRSQGTGVMGHCKLPNMGAGNWSWAFCCFVKTQFSFPISRSLCWYFYPAPEFNVLCWSIVDWAFFEIVILFKTKFFNSFLIFQSTECLQFMFWDITGFFCEVMLTHFCIFLQFPCWNKWLLGDIFSVIASFVFHS